ncbi:DUF485 domain-containing protein [Amycolatopsis carbonis]|uniref:DUF485 domain-containing protein n=1 Tax=Amycolatopsis carbonis TaxID=715471 RepID=A0A9Y2MX22_9PSEU|nr:DUF485 domain-containing protein [Amycolatopsis sp. 2-15]WIX78372.1 DUF485 domain-containing protein [Amycolatopsis sp. 2-15]
MHNVANTPAASNPLEETGQLPAMFAREGAEPAPATRRGPDYDLIQRSPEFTALRRRFRRFVFPMSAGFFVWYLTYVVLAAYANDFMSTRVFGLVNVGMLLGLAQFVTTALITLVYVRFANREVDPRVAELRERAAVTEGTRQ